MTDLTIEDAYITNKATIINGNYNASGYNHTVVIDNNARSLVPSDVQLYTQKTGNFNLNIDGSINITTNAPVVHYNPHILVNGYHSENSFTKLTLKENIIQQVAKDIYKNAVVPDVSLLKAIDVKLDTSNIIMTEIDNFNLSKDCDTIKDGQNISLEKNENIGG
jgi:hypothetical protein